MHRTFPVLMLVLGFVVGSSVAVAYATLGIDLFGDVFIDGSLTVQDGTEGLGKVFTSDSAGTGSWQPNPGGAPLSIQTIHTEGGIITSITDGTVVLSQSVTLTGSGHAIVSASIRASGQNSVGLFVDGTQVSRSTESSQVTNTVPLNWSGQLSSGTHTIEVRHQGSTTPGFYCGGGLPTCTISTLVLE